MTETTATVTPSTPSPRWRIQNPALNPPIVDFESEDEQAALREYAARDARARGFILAKSENGGTSWQEVAARAPDAVSPPIVAEKSDDEARGSMSSKQRK